MSSIILYIVFGIMGFILLFLGGYFTGGITGMMLGLFGGMIMFMPIVMMIGYAKNKGFLPLYKNLKDNEKYVMFPDSFGRLKFLIMNTIYPGILHKKTIGYIDDKGTEFAFGPDKASIGIPQKGVTVDLKNIHYNSLLKDDGIQDYDDAIKNYLTNEQFIEFQNKFRQNLKPDIYDINAELQWLQEISNPTDELKKEVFGETVDFKDNLQSLKYIYNPISMENAVDTVKIWTKREQMGYKDLDKAQSRAKMIVTIIFAVGIFIIMLTAVDWTNILSMFG